jgi:hypothetical protein
VVTGVEVGVGDINGVVDGVGVGLGATTLIVPVIIEPCREQ